MGSRQNKWKRKLLIISGTVTLILIVLVVGYHLKTRVIPPEIPDSSRMDYKVFKPEPGMFTCENCWLKQSNSGLWELYIEGDPFKRGVIEGKLTKFLIDRQEEAFIKRLQQLVPASFSQHFLKYFIYWFNRDLEQFVTDEHKLQIYGISLSAPDRFSFMGTKYQRMLNYHSAHDIGHALVNMGMVGCTSFGVWNEKSTTSKLLIGRNFDFYMGDDFAKEKIICFEKPDQGFPFMIVTWGGMIGAVSGMNDQGLTVSINAAKSNVPFSSKTPISLVAREILQYASNIREALEISRKRQTFVSESILVGSAKDNKAIIIEKSPDQFEIVESSKGEIICTNHFQSLEFQKDPLIISDMIENASAYRYQKVSEAISEKTPVSVQDIANILRDRSGLNGKDIGNGNEKAINQLIAHHSIIFEPSTLRAWVSTTDWQLGMFVCYDISKIFHNFAGLQKKVEIQESELAIASDTFLFSPEFRNFLKYRKIKSALEQDPVSGKRIEISDTFFEEFIETNPDYFDVYEISGDYYYKRGQSNIAAGFYKRALQKVLPRKKDQDRIIRKLVNCR